MFERSFKCACILPIYSLLVHLKLWAMLLQWCRDAMRLILFFHNNSSCKAQLNKYQALLCHQLCSEVSSLELLYAYRFQPTINDVYLDQTVAMRKKEWANSPCYCFYCCYTVMDKRKASISIYQFLRNRSELNLISCSGKPSCLGCAL